MIGQLVNVLGPIMVITLIGYLLGRSNMALHAGTLSAVVILVATPALIFSTLTALHVSGDTMIHMASAALLCVSIAAGLGIVALLVTGASIRSFLPSLMLPNSGNLGLPLVLLAFGPEGMRLGVSYFFVIALVQHSVGLSISAGSVRLSQLARQPLIYSVLAVIIVTSMDLPVPEVVTTTTKMLGGMMIPAMLILLGGSLATLQVSDLKPAIAVAFGRLIIGLISAFIVIWLLSLTGVEAGTVFLLATMPTAIVTYIFAERYRPNPGQVAGAVVVSTALTFICLPAILWAALAMAAGQH